jgi:hypothetical protein
MPSDLATVQDGRWVGHTGTLMSLDAVRCETTIQDDRELDMEPNMSGGSHARFLRTRHNDAAPKAMANAK